MAGQTVEVALGTPGPSASFQIPPKLVPFVDSVFAEIDNSFGADTTPTLLVAGPNGDTVAAIPQDGILPGGDAGSATWALRLAAKSGTIREITSDDGSILVDRPFGPVTDISVQAQPRVGGHFQSLLNGLSKGTTQLVPITIIDYDPQGMCAALGDTFVTIQQHGLYLCIGTASFQNVPANGVVEAQFTNTTGFAGLYPLAPEGSVKGLAPNPHVVGGDPCITTAFVGPLDTAATMEFAVNIANMPDGVANVVCVFSLTHIGF